MKKLLLILFLLSNLLLKAQVVFQHYYSNVPYCSILTNDQGYVFCGFCPDNSTMPVSSDILLVKTNADGDTLWKKTYHGPADDTGWDVKLTFDGGYILTGITNSFGSGQGDILLLKADSLGNILWSTVVGGSLDDYGTHVQQTADSGYIVCGMTKSFGAGGEDFYLVKANSTGNVQWTKTYGGTKNDYPHSVYQTSDMGFIIGGTSSSFTSLTNDYDAYIVKVDSIGNLQWSNTYEPALNDISDFYHTRPVDDGGYIATGYTLTSGLIGEEMIFTKLNATGNTQWVNKITGGATELGRFIEPVDNGYIITGTTYNSPSTPKFHPFLAKTDTSGNIVWSKKYISSLGYAQEGLTVHQTPDGGYSLLANSSPVIGYTFTHTYFVKTDSLGNSGCNDSALVLIPTALSVPAVLQVSTVLSGGIYISPVFSDIHAPLNDYLLCSGSINVIEVENNFTFTFYPNPATHKLTIEATTQNGFIVLVDITGHVLKQTVINAGRTEIDVHDLPNGVYFVRCNSAVKKFIVNR
ncbi:MAG TPA: T9SS type A sorting domain-containing protein [Flavobacteriales bacterium]|nr:T9SS type A sorting domain-containing protein [Flavobacteriales bacterium]